MKVPLLLMETEAASVVVIVAGLAVSEGPVSLLSTLPARNTWGVLGAAAPSTNCVLPMAWYGPSLVAPGLMLMVYCLLPVQLYLSVAVTVKVKLPVGLGVRVIALAVLRLRPVDAEPAVTANI